MAAIKNISVAAAIVEVLSVLGISALKDEILRGQHFFFPSACASIFSLHQLASPTSQLVYSLLLCLLTLDLDQNMFTVY